MCLGAILSSRIKRVIYGAKDIRLGACGSYVDLNKEHPFNQIDIQGESIRCQLCISQWYRMPYV
jgi:tRNA(adenine34) deaminase